MGQEADDLVLGEAEGTELYGGGVDQVIEVAHRVEQGICARQVWRIQQRGDELGVGQGGRASHQDGKQQAFVGERGRGDLCHGALLGPRGRQKEASRLSAREGLDRRRGGRR